MRLVLLGAAAVLCAPPALAAQAGSSHVALPSATAAGDSARLHVALRQAIRELGDAELHVARQMETRDARGNLRPIPDGLRTRHEAALATARAMLDTVALGQPWGRDALDALRRAHPGSALLDRYDATLAIREGRLDAALARLEALIRATPADAALHGQHGEVMARLGRPAQAIASHERALEIAPEDTAAYARLRSLHARAGTLAELLAQVRRLRTRREESRVLREHEIELLHRLGRLEEAARVAAEPQP